MRVRGGVGGSGRRVCACGKGLQLAGAPPGWAEVQEGRRRRGGSTTEPPLTPKL